MNPLKKNKKKPNVNLESLRGEWSFMHWAYEKPAQFGVARAHSSIHDLECKIIGYFIGAHPILTVLGPIGGLQVNK